MSDVVLRDLDASSQDEVRSMIVAGLTEHWGVVDESLNGDLDDMLESYASGRTVVAIDRRGAIVGTGTVVPRDDNVAEIVRMSVRLDARDTGIGRLIVDELVTTARRWACERVVLETSSAWTEVVAFYLRCGFAITHTEDGEFGSDTWFALDLSETAGFDLHALHEAIDAQRRQMGLSWAALSRHVGVATTTIRRYETASDAEADGVLALIAWLGTTPEDYVAGSTATGVRLAETGEGFVRVDMERVTALQQSPAGSRARTRTTIQRLVDVAQRAGESVASLTRVSEI